MCFGSLQAIYKAVAERLVHSTVLEGLHACLFAYGKSLATISFTLGSGSGFIAAHTAKKLQGRVGHKHARLC
jgi:hypothetical protein